jgi:hypothetical protein
MSLFKRKPESPQEIAAEKRLDEGTREVASQELGKEVSREKSGFLGPLTYAFRRARPSALRRVSGDPVPEPVENPDPGSEEGLRDALRDHDSE